MTVIRVFPEYGHPSSLWASPELVARQTRQPFVMPEDLGIAAELGEKILAWTGVFRANEVEKVDDFDVRPRWKDPSARWSWYDTGREVIAELRAAFPEVEIRAQFAGYVFSVNERRENVGKIPLTMPGVVKAGHLDVRELGGAGRR